MKCNNCLEKPRIVSCTVNESGKHHSHNDEPAVIFDDGTKLWFSNGSNHRENKPAKIWLDGCREWYFDDALHREDGPACSYPEDHDDKRWWCLKGDRAAVILEEELYTKKVIQIEGKIAIITKQMNDLFFEVVIGDKKELIVSLYKYKESNEV